MPKEEQFACSAMTSQNLYYLGNENLKHKILSISEQEGVRDSSYQLKLLQSEGHLSLVATGKESVGAWPVNRRVVGNDTPIIAGTVCLDTGSSEGNRCHSG